MIEFEGLEEPGIDEPDLAKTDGSTIFTIAQNTLFAIAVGGGALLEARDAAGTLLLRAARGLGPGGQGGNGSSGRGQGLAAADGPAPLRLGPDGKYPVPEPGIKKTREY